MRRELKFPNAIRLAYRICKTKKIPVSSEKLTRFVLLDNRWGERTAWTADERKEKKALMSAHFQNNFAMPVPIKNKNAITQ